MNLEYELIIPFAALLIGLLLGRYSKAREILTAFCRAGADGNFTEEELAKILEIMRGKADE